MRTVNIKGKNYVEVSERIKAFRSMKEYEGFSLETIIIKLETELCVMQAVIKDKEGVIKATGTAYETPKTNTMVNKTSFIENCETSAWGRALGNLGIGIDCGIATVEEMKNEVKTKKTEEEATIKQQILNRLSTISEEEKQPYRDGITAGTWQFNQEFLDHLINKYGAK